MGPDAGFAPKPPFDDPKAATSAYRAAAQAFGEVAGALNETRDRDTLLRLIGRHICQLVGIERCSVYLRDDETGLYRGQAGWSPAWERGDEPDAQERIKRLVAGTEADEFTREIVTTRRPVVVADTHSDPRPIRSAMLSWGIRSILGVPMVLRGEVIGIIFLDNADEPHVFTSTEGEIAATFADLAAVVISQAQMTGRLRRSLHTVARQNELLRRAAEMDETLTGLVLTGASLGQIAEAVTKLTGKPCEIYGADHRRLAAASPATPRGEPQPRTFDAGVRSHPAVREALEGLDDRESGVVGPLPEAGLTHRYLLAAIATRDDLWGSLVVVEHGSRFGPLDAHIARRAAANVALELAAERRAARAEWDARGSLAGQLIRATSDFGAITRRAQYLGVDLRAPHVVCIVGTRSDAGLPAVADVAAAFAQRERRVLATAVAEGVLVILPLDADAPPLEAMAAARDDVEQALDRFRTEAPLVAGIASRCTDASHYVRAHEEARQVMRCVQAFAGGDRSLVLAAEDLGAGRLFLASSSRAEAERFADDALGALLRLENDAKGDLLHTLAVFFDSSRSVRNTALALGVHENTIRYRLARIHELTGLAVGSDSADDLTAHVALLVLRLGRLA